MNTEYSIFFEQKNKDSLSVLTDHSNKVMPGRAEASAYWDLVSSLAQQALGFQRDHWVTSYDLDGL